MPRRSAEPKKTRQRAPRRSTEEVRTLIVQAATELFTERGYNQTTMRDVASTAGIALSVLYRQFESKERLFSATFVAPFLASFEHFRADRESVATSDALNSDRVDDFIRELRSDLSERRRTIVTLLGALEYPGTELIDEVRAGLGDAWQNLRLAGPLDADGASAQADRARDANMLVVAMVVGLVVFEPWIAVARDGDVDLEPVMELAGAFSTAGLSAAVEAPIASPADKVAG